MAEFLISPPASRPTLSLVPEMLPPHLNPVSHQHRHRLVRPRHEFHLHHRHLPPTSFPLSSLPSLTSVQLTSNLHLAHQHHTRRQLTHQLYLPFADQHLPLPPLPLPSPHLQNPLLLQSLQLLSQSRLRFELTWSIVTQLRSPSVPQHPSTLPPPPSTGLALLALRRHPAAPSNASVRRRRQRKRGLATRLRQQHREAPNWARGSALPANALWRLTNLHRRKGRLPLPELRSLQSRLARARSPTSSIQTTLNHPLARAADMWPRFLPLLVFVLLVDPLTLINMYWVCIFGIPPRAT